MTENCLDIGTIQAFLDGELRSGESTRVSSHLALCDTCMSMLAEAEDESAIVFPALEREFNTLVPTQRLWTKINQALVTERENAPFWQKAWAFLALSIANPSITVAASLVLVVGVVAAIWMNKVTDQTVAFNPAPTTSASRSQAPASTQQIETPVPVLVSSSRAETASYRPESRPVNVVQASYSSRVVAAGTANGYLPGEESYVKTISNLARTVNEQKDEVMRPSERIAYESDMAVVDDAIVKMRTEVKKNPRNESAKQVLYTSYQNKIDLLNSVSQKQELMASMR